MARSSLHCTCLALAGMLAGCAVAPTSPSVTVLPGTQKTAAQFSADNAACQQQAQALVAPQTDAANTQAVGSAVVGTAIGAAVGALLGSGYYYYNNNSVAWGAGTGLMMGSAVGGSQSQAAGYGLQQRFDQSFVQCMYLRGHQVPGQVAYRRAAPAAQAAPAVPPRRPAAPPTYPPPDYPPPAPSTPRYPPPNTLPPV